MIVDIRLILPQIADPRLFNALLLERQQRGGWGTAVIPRLSRDIHNELPEVKGFSERNIGYMIQFAREYGPPILQQPVAKLERGRKSRQAIERQALLGSDLEKLQQLVAKIPWGHCYVSGISLDRLGYAHAEHRAKTEEPKDCLAYV